MSFIYTLRTKEITLREDIPGDVVRMLNSFINGYASEGFESPHPLFQTERWHSLFCPNGFHEGYPKFAKRGKYYRLTIHCDINYGSEEIEQFALWITPFVAGHKPREYIGWYKHGDSAYGERNNVYIERTKVENRV
jgi:hypothetical protein